MKKHYIVMMILLGLIILFCKTNIYANSFANIAPQINLDTYITTDEKIGFSISYKNDYYDQTKEYVCEMSHDNINYIDTENIDISSITVRAQGEDFYFRVISKDGELCSNVVHKFVINPMSIGFQIVKKETDIIAPGSQFQLEVIPYSTYPNNDIDFQKIKENINLKWFIRTSHEGPLRTDIVNESCKNFAGLSIDDNGFLSIDNNDYWDNKSVEIICRLDYDNNELADIKSYGLNEFEISPSVKKIVFSEKSIFNTTLAVGEAGKISAKAEPANAPQNIIFTSSDTSIIKVNQLGNIVAMGVGKATVIATAYNGVSNSIEIEVCNPFISFKNDKVYVGEEISENRINCCHKVNSVKSKNPSIVKIKKVYKSDDYEYTVKYESQKPGTTNIIIDADGKVISFQVTVKSQKFEYKKLNLKVKQKKKNQIARYHYLCTKIHWKSSNPKVATVSSKGIVYGKKKGKTKITATIKKSKISYWVYVK